MNGNAVKEIWDQAYAAGYNQGTMSPRPEPQPHPLERNVQTGDYVIRQLENGFVIFRVASEGYISKTWLVEGGLVEVGKQLQAIEATKQMQQDQLYADVAITQAPQYIQTSTTSSLLGGYPTNASLMKPNP